MGYLHLAMHPVLPKISCWGYKPPENWSGQDASFEESQIPGGRVRREEPQKVQSFSGGIKVGGAGFGDVFLAKGTSNICRRLLFDLNKYWGSPKPFAGSPFQ